MFKPDKNRDISRSVMSQINQERIEMHSKSYFIIRKLLLYFGLILFLGTCIYLTSLVIFKINLYNPSGFLMFGSMGFRAFFLALPLIIMIFSVLSFIVTIVMLNNFGFVYKRGLFTNVLGLFVFIYVSGLTLDNTGLNSYLRSTKKLPLLYHGQFVTEYGVMGKVIKVNNVDKRILIMTKNGDKITVEWNEKTKYPKRSSFNVNDYIQAIGYLNRAIFQATGIVSASH